MLKELKFLGDALANPVKPFTAILGGAKISDKIGVIERLLEISDQLLIGGGMANTFLAAQGHEMGDSLVEQDALERAASLLASSNGSIFLPTDVVIADAFSQEASFKTVDRAEIPSGWRVMDIGTESIRAYCDVIEASKLIVWNGPMGVFEFEPFAVGTKLVAQAVAGSSAVSIVGGGDSAAAIRQAGLVDRIDHVSTGGGASLEFLEGKKLPGIAALLDR